MERKRKIGLAMPVVVLGLLVVPIGSTVSAGMESWTPLAGPTITGGSVVDLAVGDGTLYAVANPPGSESMYFGAMGKVFKSSDGPIAGAQYTVQPLSSKHWLLLTATFTSVAGVTATRLLFWVAPMVVKVGMMSTSPTGGGAASITWLSIPTTAPSSMLPAWKLRLRIPASRMV